MFFRNLLTLRTSGTQDSIGGSDIAIQDPSPNVGSHRRKGQERRAGGLTKWDAAGILTGFLLMIAVTATISRGRIFWEDEMLGWMLLRDPSWHHMIKAWKAGADGGGFLFYLSGRAWFYVFGPSSLSFRLYSTTCFGLAFAVTWVAARRFYGISIVAFAAFDTFFFSRTLLLHMREGRFYGLLVFGVALAFWLVLVLADLPKRPSAPWYALLFLVHGILTTSHLLGIAYSASMLVATVLLDISDRRWRPLLYLSGASAWLLLLLERPNIAASAAVGKPHFWLGAPNLFDILGIYTGMSNVICLVIWASSCVIAWGLWRGRTGCAATLHSAYVARRPVYVTTAALLLVPGAFLVEGLVGTWLFNNRYLLPVLIAIVYLTAEVAQLVWSHAAIDLFQRWPKEMRDLGVVVLCGYVALLLFWTFHHVIDFTPSATDYTAQLTAKLPKGVPVVCEDAFSFTELIGRQHATGVRYMFVLDWDQALSASAPPLEVTQYHLMEIWKKVGYFSGSIQPIQKFLEENDRFLVLHTSPIPAQTTPPEIGNPLVDRFRKNPGYEVRPYTQADRKLIQERVFLVCRGSCGEAGERPDL